MDPDSVWSDETEHLLSQWAEKASCFRWRHVRAKVGVLGEVLWGVERECYRWRAC